VKFSGKTALVTGAASGISREIAVALGDEGAHVICADRNARGAAATVAMICSRGGTAHAVICDVTSAADIDAAVAFAGSVGAGLDILVNGAGIMRAESLLDVTRDSFDAVMGINARGLFFMLQAGARTMIAAGRQGRIVNLASISGRQGNAGALQYCASKAAVISITQSAAQALAPHGITVNAIAPGFVQTSMWAELEAMAEQKSPGTSAEQFNRHLASTVAVGRLAQPADIVSTALFLASADAHYVVGQTINVDGGVNYN
jgi:NAD(P)-dependent dehydrogenase (short-subunit alcohol dehydrogenase family)